MKCAFASHTLLFITFAAYILLNPSACLAAGQSPKYADYVDTRIGTAPSETHTAGMFGKKTEEFGQTLPAVLTPYGMNFWTPQTRDTEQKCIAPYYYLDDKLQGFRNSHWIVGGCTQDYGSMTLMPLYDTLRCSPEQRACSFSHDCETARPDYYSVELPDEGITAEVTGTSRAAIFRFTYAKGGKAYIVVNPNSDEAMGTINVDPLQGTISGSNPVHRIYQGKGQEAGFSGHFYITTDHTPTSGAAFTDYQVNEGTLSASQRPGIGAYLEFDVEPGENIIVRVGTSFTSIAAARNNLEAEIPYPDFEHVREQLADTWQRHLGTIEVTADTEEELRKFYGALYRTSFLPHEVNDADGAYCRFASGEAAGGENGKRYFDDYSLWDTYRAQHPLITLLHPTLSGEMMQSLVDKAQAGGWLPIFPCWNSYTAAMIGDHATAAIADAYVKGVRNFDIEEAYRYMRKNAFEPAPTEEYLDGKGRRALPSYLKYGFIPVEDSVLDAYHKMEQVSRTMEYAFDDYALAQVARALGKEADYKTLAERSLNYRYVINPANGYACGRHADGTFTADVPTAFSRHITEGAPCHYTWYAPHDPEGLMMMMGGRDAYVAKLDSMFSEGRYWHGNEPCHQVAYMFGYAGEPWKTARAVRHILDTEYLCTPGGLSGNDDAGQMSAWYVFSALGFYPACPASPYYMLSSPTFKKAVIHLENGRDLTLLAPEASKDRIYIRSITRNCEPYSHPYLLHSDLLQGGEYLFDLTDK